MGGELLFAAAAKAPRPHRENGHSVETQYRGSLDWHDGR